MAVKKAAGSRTKAKITKPAQSGVSKLVPAKVTSAAVESKTTPPTSAKIVKAATETPVVEEQPMVLRKKELFERVVTLSGAKKRDVKVVVEATLKVLGDALAAGESLALPPFGRAKVNRQKDLASGEMMMVRLRRNSEDERVELPAAPLADVSR